MPVTLGSREIYKGRIFDLRVDTINEGEITYEREIIVHRGSAVIVPIFDDNTVALVRQYRHASGRYLLEVPAGSLEPDEEPRSGAIRELEEEVGVTARSIDLISEFYVSPGFLTEKMFVYLASGLSSTSQRLDSDEIVEIERVPLSEAVKMAKDGRIEDAKSIIGLLRAAEKLG
jgi:ADP-ribose pyrophosphatase